MKRLGERIKRKREELHLQLNDLAKKVGVSSSALSQIENSKATPSLFTLKSIADNLHTTVGALIGEYEAVNYNPLVRFEDKSFVERNESGTSLYLLSHHGTNKQIDIFLMEFCEDSDSNGFMKEHPGQEFLFVLKGKLEFKLDDKVYILKANDSLYFNSNGSHFGRNIGEKTAQIIWIISPPTY